MTAPGPAPAAAPAPAPAPGPARPVAAAGGAGGIEAQFDDLARLAAHVLGTGLALGVLATQADLDGVVLLDPAAAVLDPVGAATALGALTAATHGPRGVATLAATALALAATVRAALTAYTAAEAVTASRLAQAVAGTLRAVAALPGAVATGVAATLDTGDLAFAAQVALDSAPQLVDGVVLAAGAGRPALVARGLATAFPDGRAVLSAGTGSVGQDPVGPPRDVQALVQGLTTRNHDVPGAIDVRVLTTVDPDGTVHRRAVVDVPGTKDWSLASENPDVTNLGSNLRALSGADTTYADGVLAALAAAGFGPGSEVLFVGHSLGGMVALAAAGRAQAAGYRVGGVVTAGSPLGAVPAPPGVPVLAIENRTDVVPHLDGAANPAGPDVTTVTVDRPAVAIGDNHGLDTAYLPGAADVDASTDPTVVAARNRLAPFLTADTVETHVYVVTRELP